MNYIHKPTRQLFGLIECNELKDTLDEEKSKSTRDKQKKITKNK